MEREGITLYETKEGFFGYILKSDGIMVTDLFIGPEHRGKESSKHFVDKIEETAREHGFSIIYCTTCKDALNFDIAHSFIVKNGYKPMKETDDLRYYFKKLEE